MGEYMFGGLVALITLMQFFYLLWLNWQVARDVQRMRGEDEEYLDQLKKLRDDIYDAMQMRMAQMLEKTTKQIDGVREKGEEHTRTMITTLRGQFLSERDSLRSDFSTAKTAFQTSLRARESEIRNLEQAMARIEASKTRIDEAKVRIGLIENNLETWKINSVTEMEEIKAMLSKQAERHHDDACDMNPRQKDMIKELKTKFEAMTKPRDPELKEFGGQKLPD